MYISYNRHTKCKIYCHQIGDLRCMFFTKAHRKSMNQFVPISSYELVVGQVGFFHLATSLREGKLNSN